MSPGGTILVTGGVGSGKSTVCSWLRTKGVPVYDCDSAAKEIYSRYPSVVEGLEEVLGSSLRLPDGSLDRPHLASVVFSDPSRLAALEAIVHPLVLEDFRCWRECTGSPIVVMESAIAFSKPLFQGEFDAIVLVDAPVEKRVERFCTRSGSSREDALARIASQSLPTGGVDEVIVNDSSLEDLYARCEEVFGRIMVRWT